jgi:glycopeptide antibiotics resistance protein
MKKRLLSVFILITYVVILVRILVFKNVPVIRVGPVLLKFGGTHEGPANLVPFKTILPYLLGEQGLVIAVLNIAGNILLLVPVGFLVPFVFRGMTWKKTIVLAIAAGLVIEGMQAVLHIGIFDIDDVILNGLGVILGYWMFTILPTMLNSKKFRIVTITAIVIVAAVAGYFTFTIFQKPRLPDHFVRNTVNADTVDVENGEKKIRQGKDPCNGTGGTGQIMSVGTNSFTIKRNDGTDQIITLSDHAKISNSAGPLSASDLKRGDRVTVVIMPGQDGIETAGTVLVCNGANP